MTKRECAFARRSEYLGALLILLAVYFFAGNLGLKLAFVHASATAVWPPTGIALAGLLVLGYRVWPAIFLGAFLVNVTTDGAVATSIGIATGNTLEGLLGAYFVRRFAGGRDAFNQPRTVFKFAALAGPVSTTVSATIGVASLLLGGSASWANSGAIWLTWWLGDTAGALIVAPLFILWSARRGLLWSRARALEATLLLLVLILVGQVEFAGLVPAGVKNYPLSFLCLPPVVWAAFRFGQRETVTVACLLSGIAIWGTLHGYGPFVGGTPNESLIFLQAFMGVLAVMALAVAAVAAEQRHAEEALRKAHDELERRVAERTDELAKANHALQASREQLAEAQQIAQVGSWEWDIAKNIVSWSDEMYRNYGLKPQEVSLTYERFLEFVHSDDRSFVREIVERAVRDHKSFAFDHRVVRPDGTERIIHARGEVIVDEAGHALRMVGTGQDITERKLAEAALVCGHNELEERVQERTAELTAANDAFLAEIVEHKQTAEALRDSQTKFQAIFENSIDAIAVSKNGVHVLVNPTYLKMFGHSQVEEVVGRPVLESIAPSQREMIRERIQHRATGEAAPTHYETRGLRRDGAEFDLEVDVSSYKLKGEIYTLVILRDATKRKQAERSLRESEALKGAILESALDCIIAMNHEGNVIEWNPAAERTFGYRRADVLGRDMSELIIPSGLREKHRHGLARFLSTGKGNVVGKRVEMTGRRADGSEFPVELAITLIEREGLPAFTGYARDITERKRAEEARNQLAAIVESSGDAIISKALDGTIVSWNAGAERIFGYSAPEVIGRPITVLIPVEHLQEEPQILEMLKRGERVEHFETVRTRKDGSRIDVSLAISAVKDAAGRVIGASKIARDITERKRTEEALRQSEARKGAILETALDAILSIDQEGRISEWNRAAETIFGYRKTEALSRKMEELIIPPSLREYYHDGLAEYLMTGVGSLLGRPIELTVMRADGTEFRAELAITRNSWDEPTLYTCFIRDITERKRAEEEIRKLNTELEQRVIERTAQLEAINNELESFTYSVSHDLRAPLRAMQGLAAALLEDYQETLDQTGRDYARRIQIAASRMETLIQDLLAYSRLSRMDVELRAVELDSVLAEVRSQLEVDLLDRDATVVIEGPLPLVVGHRATLVQIFSNLISNGVKFMGSGVAPRLRIHPEERGKVVRLWVEDNGIGIAPEYHERIFRIFERLHGVETYPGTGIGLAIVQKGAARLGGRVGVESTEGEGSRFWVELTKANV